MKVTKYEDLKIWKDSISLVKEIYKLTSCGKFSRDYGLRDQIQKSAVSISSNIVEGFEKSNNNEFIRFLKIAKGSIGETKNLLLISKEIGYVEMVKFKEIEQMLEDLILQVGKLISYLENKRKSGEFIK